jgi:hypothetical protein
MSDVPGGPYSTRQRGEWSQRFSNTIRVGTFLAAMVACATGLTTLLGYAGDALFSSHDFHRDFVALTNEVHGVNTRLDKNDQDTYQFRVWIEEQVEWLGNRDTVLENRIGVEAPPHPLRRSIPH